MSDISDVLVVLAKLAVAALYPNGPNAPSVTGGDIVVYPGWPASDSLDQELLAGKTHVSVFSKAEERNTTRYREACQVIKAPAPTLTLAAVPPSGSGGFTVTVGGTVSVPQNAMLRVNGIDYAYAVQPADTLASIASSLAGLVAADVAGTTAQGISVMVGPSGRVQAARVGGFGTVAREIRRQEHIVMLTVWAGNPAQRDKVASAIDVDLAGRKFIAMPDGFGARLVYKNSLVVDALQKAVLYRRDLNYSVEFATTVSEQAAAVIAPKLTLQSTINLTV